MAVSLTSGTTLRWCGAALAAIISLPLQAATQVSVESVSYAYSNGNYNPDSDSASGSAPKSVFSYAFNPSPYAKGTSAASAGSGSVATASLASINDTDFSDQFEAVAQALARSTSDDLMFTSAGSTITTSLNLSWSGLMTSVLNPANFNTYGTATNTVNISGKIFSGTTTYLNFSGERTVSIVQEDPNAPHDTVIFTSGIIDGNWPPNGNLVTDMFTAPTNTPLSLELSLFSRSTVGFQPNDPNSSEPLQGNAYTISNFGHTFSLATSGPVFNLGAGESASSLSAEITGNEWTGTSVTASVVPIPPAIYLFGSGLLVLAGLRRRKTVSR